MELEVETFMSEEVVWELEVVFSDSGGSADDPFVFLHEPFFDGCLHSGLYFVVNWCKVMGDLYAPCMRCKSMARIGTCT